METTSADTDSSKSALYQIVDYGTKNLSAGAQIGRSDQNPHPGGTAVLNIQASKPEVPQIVGYVERDGSLEFVWGHELSRLLASKNDAHTVVASFERLKLALLGTAKEAVATRKLIKKSLKCLDVPEKTVEDLFVRHLVEIKSALASAVTDKYQFAAQPISGMPHYVFFAVPEITNLGNRHKLALLLKRAEFPETILVPETEAAGAWHAYKYCKEDPSISSQLFSPGNELLVADLGGWTCNLASYTITGPTEDGARIGMKATGKKDSQPLGSEMITLKFLGHVHAFLRSNYPGKQADDALAELGMSQTALDHSLSRDFESYKTNFENEGDRTFTIKSSPFGEYYANNNQHLTISVEVTQEHVERWLDIALKKIVRAIDNIRSANTKTISMTGGFSLNTFLVGKLKKHYGSLGIAVIDSGKDSYGSADLAVVRGAAARFKVETTNAPFKYALGMPQDEYYDPEQHPDIAAGSQEIVRYGDVAYVEDRWQPLLPLGQVVNGHESISHSCWLEYVLDEKAWEVTKTIYFTETDIPEHADLYPTGGLRSDIHVYDKVEWSVPLEEVKKMTMIDKPEPGPTTKNGKKVEGKNEYHVGLLFTTTIEGMDISMKLERTPGGYILYRHFYEDTGELVPVGSQDVIGGIPDKRTQVQRMHPPPLEDMIPVTMISLLDPKYHPELQREEGTDVAEEAAGGMIDAIEDDDEDEAPSTKRRRPEAPARKRKYEST